MDTVGACQRAVDDAQAIVGTVRPEDLSAATPCTEWDVRQLINHMIGVCEFFGGALAAAAGAPVAPVPPGSDEADRVGDDPAAAYAGAAGAMMQQWRAPDALGRTLKLPFGETPAARAARIVVADQMLHTWDLARALGRPYTLDPDLATAALEMMQELLKPENRGTAFAAEVACRADAPIQDRLLAFSGRQP